MKYQITLTDVTAEDLEALAKIAAKKDIRWQKSPSTPKSTHQSPTITPPTKFQMTPNTPESLAEDEETLNALKNSSGDILPKVAASLFKQHNVPTIFYAEMPDDMKEAIESFTVTPKKAEALAWLAHRNPSQVAKRIKWMEDKGYNPSPEDVQFMEKLKTAEV